MNSWLNYINWFNQKRMVHAKEIAVLGIGVWAVLTIGLLALAVIQYIQFDRAALTTGVTLILAFMQFIRQISLYLNERDLEIMARAEG